MILFKHRIKNSPSLKLFPFPRYALVPAVVILKSEYEESFRFHPLARADGDNAKRRSTATLLTTGSICLMSQVLSTSSYPSTKRISCLFLFSSIVLYFWASYTATSQYSRPPILARPLQQKKPTPFSSTHQRIGALRTNTAHPKIWILH